MRFCHAGHWKNSLFLSEMDEAGRVRRPWRERRSAGRGRGGAVPVWAARARLLQREAAGVRAAEEGAHTKGVIKYHPPLHVQLFCAQREL